MVIAHAQPLRVRDAEVRMMKKLVKSLQMRMENAEYAGIRVKHGLQQLQSK